MQGKPSVGTGAVIDMARPPASRPAFGPGHEVHHLYGTWYTSCMPTTRPRHQITETPDVERALDLAARRWPLEPRSKLLLRLIHTGSSALEQELSEEGRARLEAIKASSGKYPDAFGENYLAELRQDWPE